MTRLRARARFDSALAFLRRRLSPGGDLGLHLTIGVLVLIGACWAFGEITEDVLTGDPLTLVDQRVAAFFHANATPLRNQIMAVISFFGAGPFLGAMGGAGALWLIWRRSWYRLLALLLVQPGGAVIDVVVKHLIHRQRPVFENPIATLNSYSFPSGHTMGATLFYGLLAALAMQEFRGWKPKTAAIAVAVVIVLLVGFSRICLGLHYLSDVLGAMAAGVAWLALCLTTMETFRRRREKRASPP
jgi:membrane-associated phospholipid phosphatase